MYINPQTNIRLLKDVPLDSTYEHTIYFDNATAQYNYFISLQKYNLTNYTYQRVNKGIARVGIKADNLYDCNYLMFQNTAFGNKWFYAFISSVEYVNNECSEITFEIDVMQTWFFDCEPDYCFIEREHSLTDNVGDNIIPENVDCGEYVYNDYGKITNVLDPLCVVVMISEEGISPDGTLYDGVYGGCTLFAYNTDDTEAIKNKLNEYKSKPDAVVGMYMCPVIGTGGTIDKGGMKIIYSSSAETINVDGKKITGNETLDGYKPKNKKLYTYPFNFLSVETTKTSGVFRYEFFDNLTPKLKINVPIAAPIEIALRPVNYKGSGENTLNGETIILGDYPMCSWNTDAFKAWFAQNSGVIRTYASTAASVYGASLAGATLPPVALAYGAHKVLSLMMSGYRASIAADITKGTINSGNIDVASGKKTFFGGRCSVSRQYAQIIDEYFNMYGYATRITKRPNRNSRPHWNYVKTIDATITGSVPADDMRKICSIYDNGITFWKHGNEVGQYYLDNRVQGGDE